MTKQGNGERGTGNSSQREARCSQRRAASSEPRASPHALYERLDAPFELYRVHLLEASDDELLQISADRSLALSLDEMRHMRDHFAGEGRNPTDLEVEALAQAWSEHSCYKSSWPILSENIFTLKAPQNILVIEEDSGVVEFDDRHAYVVALESHNHPSALDPVGGAETGIGGILRDVVCMGAQPIALVDPLFFGRLDYPFEKLPRGIKHPSFLFRGVVGGIRDYGNRVGIPTIGGMIYFDDDYLSNCLVNVGCIGIVRKDRLIRSRAERVSDVFILVGGATGRDGIHGVSSLASQEISEESEETARSAVQMGDAITKEPLIHAALEAIQAGLVNGFKDLGGGGLSSSVGELAHVGGNGAEVTLDAVSFKVENMAAWEIWVSESQERMMLVVSPENADRVLEIFRLWDVPANVIGCVTDTKRMRITYRGIEVCDMGLAFYTGALRYRRPYILPTPTPQPDEDVPPPADWNDCLCQVLASPNVASPEWVIHQYDYEVRGATILKPLQGEIHHPGPGDASVIRPLGDSWRGLAVSTDVNPALTKIDPYWGSASAIEEAIRNVVAVGARPHSWADNLNFGNPEKPDRLGAFKASTDALHWVAGALDVPCVSGNVSFYNEGPTGSIPPTPTIMMIGMIEDVRKCVTSDFKEAANLVYLIGETHDELAGSEYFQLLGCPDKSVVPRVDREGLKQKVEALLAAIDRGYVRACHDLSNGGLGVSLAEMLIGGEVGARADVSLIPATASRPDFRLFSESNGRWLVEVGRQHREAFEKLFDGIALAGIGELVDDAEPRLTIRDGAATLIDLPVTDIRAAWRGTLERIVGD